jgi:hypothetical protein
MATTASTHTTPVHHRNLLTKKQVAWAYSFAGMTLELIPGKGKVTRLEVPSQRLLILVQPSEHRSTYGERLYLCEHSYYR